MSHATNSSRASYTGSAPDPASSKHSFGGKLLFQRWNVKVPPLELRSSSAIFWFRAIWLRSKRLPFGWVRIGNDLEMSGVLWSTSFWIAKERSLLSLAKVVIRGRKWAFLRDFLLKSLSRSPNITMKGEEDVLSLHSLRAITTDKLFPFLFAPIWNR